MKKDLLVLIRGDTKNNLDWHDIIGIGKLKTDIDFDHLAKRVGIATLDWTDSHTRDVDLYRSRLADIIEFVHFINV